MTLKEMMEAQDVDWWFGNLTYTEQYNIIYQAYLKYKKEEFNGSSIRNQQ